MKTLFLILMLCAFGNLLSQSQPRTVNSIELATAYNLLKEENLHPKLHAGMAYGLLYRKESTQARITNTELSLLYSRLKTDFENVARSIQLQINGSYALLFKIKTSDKLSYHQGPACALQYRLSYLPNWDDSHLYWANDLSLLWYHRLGYKVTKNKQLRLDLRFSLLSAISRPELNRAYKIDDVSFLGITQNMHSKLDFGSINKAFQISLQANYTLLVTPSLSQTMGYHFQLVRQSADQADTFTNLQHRLAFTVQF